MKSEQYIVSNQYRHRIVRDGCKQYVQNFSFSEYELFDYVHFDLRIFSLGVSCYYEAAILRQKVFRVLFL